MARRPVKYVTRPLANPEAAKAATTYATVPFWSNTQGTYTYQMIGANPTVAQTNQTTTVPTLIVPLVISIPSGTSTVTFDPTVTNACNTAGSALSLLQASPIFANTTYTVGGTSFGSTTYPDFFQRANFWKYTNPTTGINPNYHTLLSETAYSKIAVSVPAADGTVATASCGKLGEVNLTWFDAYIQGTIFPVLSAAGVTPSTFVIFLLNNVVMYQGTSASCCVLGYHSAYYNTYFSNTTDTYAVGDFDSSGDFGVTADASPLSHEIAEWMNDPMGTNSVPGWGNVGQVTGCQYTLEVGDPLSGTDITMAMPNGFTYHMQELAFVPWFFRISPSTSVNGWYSSNNTFKSAATACATSTTTLSLSPTSFQPGSSATIAITVAAGSGFAGTPTGTVTLVQGGTNTVLGTYTLTAGAINTSSTTLPAGSYTVTANYAGDATFEASTSTAVTLTVGTPAVSLTPTSLTFASQNVGSSSTAQSITLKNTGTAPLTGVAVSLKGASPGDYSDTTTCGASLAAAASCTISVTFKPTATGSRTATVSVADNATGSPQSVALSGTAVAPVTITPASLIFASTTVGSSSATQAITVKNTGAVAITSIAISITGANSADFSDTTTCAATLAVGASCAITVTFKPTAAGTRTASVSIADNVTGSPQTVALTGTAAAAPAPKVTLSTSSLTFASTILGSSSPAQAITVTNTGTASLSSLAISLTGTNPGDFSDTTTCGTTLAVNANCTITVTFKPTAAGARSASVSIADNATGSPQSVTLSGTGASAVTLTPASLTFATTKIASSSAAQTVTVKNAGTVSLTGVAITITGTNAADFSDTTTCTATIAAAASCTISVTFKPTATGARTASVSIADSATGSPQTVALSGTGSTTGAVFIAPNPRPRR